MPLITSFRSTDILNAFILNSLAASLIIVLAITVKSYLDRVEDKNVARISIVNILITFSVTFLTTFAAYYILYFIFGYGSGMLSRD